MEILVEQKRPGDLEDADLQSLANALAAVPGAPPVRVVGNDREPERVAVSPWEALVIWLVGVGGAATGNLLSDTVKAGAAWAKKRFDAAKKKRPIALETYDDDGIQVARVSVDDSGKLEITFIPKDPGSKPGRTRPR